MKILSALKHLTNFIFIAYIISAILILILPFINPSIQISTGPDKYLVYLAMPLLYLLIIFGILFFLRKFVVTSFRKEPIDESARKNLKFSGLFCILYGVISIPKIFALIQFYRISETTNISFMLSHIFDFGSIFYMILIGLFFIYLSKVLETSDIINQENKLTI